MSNEERRELSAAEALGALSPEELALLEDAAADDPWLAQELEADRATVAVLEARLPREAPSEDLLERIMAEVERLEAAGTDGVASAARSREPARRWLGALRLPRIAVAAATAAAAVVLGVVLLGDDGLGQPDAIAQIVGAPAFPAVTGVAELYDSGTLRVRLASAPPPPAGHHYEVWVLRNGVEAMDSVGEFNVANPQREGQEHDFRLVVDGSFAAIDISVEPNDGDADHSGVSLAGGRFTT